MAPIVIPSLTAVPSVLATQSGLAGAVAGTAEVLATEGSSFAVGGDAPPLPSHPFLIHPRRGLWSRALSQSSQAVDAMMNGAQAVYTQLTESPWWSRLAYASLVLLGVVGVPIGGSGWRRYGKGDVRSSRELGRLFSIHTPEALAKIASLLPNYTGWEMSSVHSEWPYEINVRPKVDDNLARTDPALPGILYGLNWCIGAQATNALEYRPQTLDQLSIEAADAAAKMIFWDRFVVMDGRFGLTWVVQSNPQIIDHMRNTIVQKLATIANSEILLRQIVIRGAKAHPDIAKAAIEVLAQKKTPQATEALEMLFRNDDATISDMARKYTVIH